MASRPLADLACFDPDRFERHGYPHDVWTRMRAEQPIAWHDDGIREPFWAITRYDDIAAIGKDSETFISSPGVTILRRDQMIPANAPRVPLMLTMDPPEHHKNRMILRERFKPSVMRALEEHIVARCREIADDVAARRVGTAVDGSDGTIDFVEAIAMRLPLDVILELLGVPTDDRDQMYLWSSAVIGSEDPDYGNVDLPREAIMAAQQAMFGYFARFIAARRAAPREDLVSLLVEARIDGTPLTDMEILGFCFLLAIAGNETTRNATSGAMLALIEHPDARAALTADPAAMPSAVEELLRWVTPIVYMARTATRDIDIAGQTVRAGEKVVLFYPSANRDERVFDDPFALDFARKPNRHLTFGFGRHSCLGNDLARIELRAVLAEVLARFPDLALAGPVSRLRSNFVGGIKQMPVRLHG
ncbi:cytochrome P450 [Sphingomonas jatrophae]|uniref:Cytochrome P450 n=1 Tax=Sphingomonas jatrophae TaxID=1166337 RepID=A0A1I6M4J5_9SPHN|nr:cytochrome P450 [Sphingomonas jatrophae]SFS10599.1 Cytochrome P450 [Sphingomonas jatrophae]